MVFVLDQGSKFNGSLEKVWRLHNSHSKHAHPSLRNLLGQPAGENALIFTFDYDIDGQSEKFKLKMLFNPPVGYVTEYMEGPFAGSRCFLYYIPQGDKTGVTVVGDYRSPSLSENKLRKEVMSYLHKVFAEDQANLSRLK